MDSRAQILYYANVAWRRKWLILVPLVLSVATSAVILHRLPKLYRSSTTILVTPQAVPRDLVRSTVTSTVEDSIGSLKVQVLSQTYLEKVVREFGLVPDNATDAEIERACNRLRRSVYVDYNRQKVTWFRVYVEDRDPKRCAGIANRLAQLFIEQNSLRRSEEASGTLREVERWLAEKQHLLDEKEAAIAEFKRRHPWELPENLQANLSMLEAENQRLAVVNNDIRSQEDHLAVLRVQAESQANAGAGVNPTTVADPALRKLLELQSQLADLLIRYTKDNPEVKRKQAEIDDHLARNPGLTQPVVEGEGEDEELPAPGAIGIQAEIAKVMSSIEREKEKRDGILQKVSVLQRRIDNIPELEAQLGALTRDLGTIKTDYQELLGKRDNARRAEEMEANRRGEQFRVQDVAQVPGLPYKPQPAMVLLYGALVGLGLGLGVVALLEVLDQTIRSEPQFQSVFPAVRLLVSMPHIEEPETK